MINEFMIPKRSIKEMTTDELFHIANLATDNYFNSQWSRDQKEVETGGNGWRRRVEWKMDTEGYNEYHYFEITGDSAGLDWSWSCKTTYKLSKLHIGKPDWSNAHSVNTLNPAKIVDYCREQNLDIENKLR